MLDKNLLTNVISLIIVLVGIAFQNHWIMMMGAFALSGALTNWLAIYMLFERVPGLVGSGVIPNQFEEFKSAIKNLMMEQFFTQENIDRFVQAETKSPQLKLAPVIEQVDLTPAFDKLVDVIMHSSFGSMLGMFGGADALTPLKNPFIINMKEALIEITQKEEFTALLQTEIDQPSVIAEIRQQVESIIESRLAELTPQLVKQMVQQIIKEHLGWLVVWGGVFGGLIGLASAFISQVV
ncbi:hypothetical protein [Hydrogenovibrio kuenenii]|uniref:hypothetical protein n=1 Tax=Hydrogenovibrio kuenenii TaxID=63658 RepID=UPI00046456B8|nr:hypothetical protein [Hydrogenovibrio kuenenii]